MGIYVFDCNQISRLYLRQQHKFDKYPKDKLFELDTNNTENSKKNKKKNKNKLVTIGNGINEKFEIERNGEPDFNKQRLHQQISKKLIEIGDASNMNDGDFKSVKNNT